MPIMMKMIMKARKETMQIRREEFFLLRKYKLLDDGEYFITCRHKKSRRKKILYCARHSKIQNCKANAK